MLRVNYEASKEAKHLAFPYQVEAVRAVKDLSFSAIFHEQGLGKTKIAVDLALTWLREARVDSVLILTKKSLVQNWVNEVKTHSHLPPRVLSQDKRANYYAFNSPARIYIGHYEVVLSEAARLKLFLKTRRVAVICDEAQKFKNPAGSIAGMLYELSELFERRVVMTGTPVANRPYDVWSLIKFLDGGVALGNDYKQFKSDYDLSETVAHDAQVRAAFERRLVGLMDKLRPFSVRETKASAGIALPEKEIVEIRVDLEDGQCEIYRAFREELRAVVVRHGRLEIDDVESVVKRLLRLIQVASNPHLVDKSYGREPAKLLALNSVLDEVLLTDADLKAIVWTSFTENVDWLSRELKRFGAVRVHGKLTIADRNSAIERFKKQEGCRVLVATPGAAKEGLTLTVANTAVFFDRGLSLDDYLQAQDRIHRISQQRACTIYNLIATDTVDEWVNELLAAKHLAASLALGDISRTEYDDEASYNFVTVLKRVLGENFIDKARD